MKKYEKELEEENQRYMIFENKVRNLRKERNRARLVTDKNQPNKRQKIYEENYVNIRQPWVAPKPSEA